MEQKKRSKYLIELEMYLCSISKEQKNAENSLELESEDNLKYTEKLIEREKATEKMIQFLQYFRDNQEETYNFLDMMLQKLSKLPSLLEKYYLSFTIYIFCFGGLIGIHFNYYFERLRKSTYIWIVNELILSQRFLIFFSSLNYYQSIRQTNSRNLDEFVQRDFDRTYRFLNFSRKDKLKPIQEGKFLSQD